MTAALSIQGLAHAYVQHRVLNGVDLELQPGDFLALIGPNGSGKTTLVRALLGLVPVVKGRIRLEPGMRTGYVPQRFEPDPVLPLSVARFQPFLQPTGLAGCGRAHERTSLAPFSALLACLSLRRIGARPSAPGVRPDAEIDRAIRAVRRRVRFGRFGLHHPFFGGRNLVVGVRHLQRASAGGCSAGRRCQYPTRNFRLPTSRARRR